MNKPSIQKQVRQRDRFLCQVCGTKGEQYAHIIPDTDGGEYNLNNLIFLCYEHHQQLEPARTPPLMKRKLIAIAKELRDQPKKDNLLSYIFSWPAGQYLVVRLGGGFTFINQKIILETKNNPEHPYLKLEIDDLGMLKINAYFDDSQGNSFMQIIDNNLKVHTSTAWDIIINRHSIAFEHADKKMALRIKQDEKLDLYVSGKLYLNGGYFEITDTKLVDLIFENVFEGNTAVSMNRGLLLADNGTFAF